MESTPEVRIALERRIRSLRNEIDSQAADTDEEFKALTIQQMVQVLDEWEARKLSEMDSGRTRSRSPIPRRTKRQLNRVSRQFAKEAAAAFTTSASASGSGGSAMVPEPATPPRSATSASGSGGSAMVPEPATPPRSASVPEPATPPSWRQKPPTPPMRPIREAPSDVFATLSSSAHATSTLTTGPQSTTALPKACPGAGMVSPQAGKGGRSSKGHRKGAADFDAMAGLQRQPPTLMKRFIGGELWLGPLPVQGNLAAMPRATVQVCCLETHPEQRQGLHLDGAHYVHIPISDGSRRDQTWQEAWPIMLSALRESHVVYVHCLAGRHRAAAAVTLILASLGNLALEDAARTVEDQRSTAQVWRFLQEGGNFDFMMRMRDWSHQHLQYNPRLRMQYTGSVPLLCTFPLMNVHVPCTHGKEPRMTSNSMVAALVRKHVELAAERNLKFKNHLLSTQDFLQLVDQHQNVISLDPLTSKWIRCSRRKRRHLPWEETALSIGTETALCSVSERTLAFWKEQDVNTIRSFFAPAATAKLHFKSKKAFFEKLREILDTNLHFLDCSPQKLCHFVAPARAEDVPACHFCGVSINFLKYPDKIHRRCKRVVACDASVIASWRTALTELVNDLTVVLDKF
ncbi:unnamed protein product [Symbiodinium sp. CCMP2592]|nr:unnamed protein product [Symbiodinium sp. CCMP2592]